MEVEPELVVVTLRFVATESARVAAVLARYVVTSRNHPGCINIDLCRSASEPDAFVVIEKWTSPESQRAHFDSTEMVAMANDLRGLLDRPPDIELLDAVSAHDLR